MYSVLISLASNAEQEEHLAEARKALAAALHEERYTAEIWTEPEGKAKGTSAPYLNQLVSASTSLGADELNDFLKTIERQLGRTPEMRRVGTVPIDLDLLQWDGQRFHQRDWERNYMRQLLELLQ